MEAYWSKRPEELLRLLSSAPSGLSLQEADLCLSRTGENRIAGADGPGVLALLLRQLSSPLVLILIFGACVSIVVKDWTDAIIILATVLGSTILGFSQEHRASEAIRQLRCAVARRTGRPARYERPRGC